MRARDKFVHRWKADRQVGHPVILAGPAKMISRAFYSTTASTDDVFLWIFCQSIHCYRDVKRIPWNITKSVCRAGFSNLPTLPLITNNACNPGFIMFKKRFCCYRLVEYKHEYYSK